MWSRPSWALNTLRGSSRRVSFSQVVRPARSLPLNRRTTSFGLTGSDSFSAPDDPLARPGPPRRVALRHLVEVAGVEREPLVELRLVAVQHRHQPVELLLDINDEVRLEAARLLEGVREIQDDGAARQVRRLAA